ncbi:hypothetical protein [Streptomyces fulvorobeus]|uniref:Uncharacterized protein n=1 Tax=Streptomyces fulvorobeus TaxID=284028 RepID=A0A7J0C3F4_9ACTN|nr:hypothetical protein [Streptomyces fulvorobeus]NYE40614.1 hypothetical protein [Streptomyces fulvorobeus]GFM96908.1 hypothetical protein Sfulv_17190 [Streptomyces fulvorobeus]
MAPGSRAARRRASVGPARCSCTFWCDLRLLLSRLDTGPPGTCPELRRAARALRLARLAQRLRRGRWALRLLESARRHLVRAAARGRGESEQAEVLGHLRALPQVWCSVAGPW